MDAFRVGKDGALYQIGDEGVIVGSYSVRVDGQEVLSPLAKEIWDFTIVKTRHLLGHLSKDCGREDFMFETILVQQILVMLVTGFEIYSKERFVELGGDSEPLSRNHFQSYDRTKETYKGIGIKFGEIPGLKSDVLERLQKYILWRHKIIHSSQEMVILNAEQVPAKDPIFAKRELAEIAVSDFSYFINALHIETEKLPAAITTPNVSHDAAPPSDHSPESTSSLS